MGFGSYQTAWSWLHKIRQAMVRPERAPLAARVEADETYVGGPRPGTPGRGAAGKTKVAGAVESGRGQARGRRLGRLRLAVVPDVSAKSLARLPRPATSPGRRPWRPTAGPGYAGLAAAGYAPRAAQPQRQLGRRGAAPAGDPPGVRPGQALAARHPPRRGRQASICRPTSTSSSSASTAAPPRASATASPASSSKPSSPHPPPTAPSSPTGYLRVVES